MGGGGFKANPDVHKLKTYAQGRRRIHCLVQHIRHGAFVEHTRMSENSKPGKFWGEIPLKELDALGPVLGQGKSCP